MGKEKIHRTVQRRYSEGHHQNQATHVGLLKENYKKEEEKPLCPLYEIEEDATEHVLRCGRDTDRNQRNITNNTEEEWEEVYITDS